MASQNMSSEDVMDEGLCTFHSILVDLMDDLFDPEITTEKKCNVELVAGRASRA